MMKVIFIFLCLCFMGVCVGLGPKVNVQYSKNSKSVCAAVFYICSVLSHVTN